METVVDDSTPVILAFQDARQDFEAAYVDRLLDETSGNVSQAAVLAQMDRKSFYAVILRAGVDPDDHREDRS